MFEVGQEIAGRYTLERRLGQGGMGVVFAAMDASLRRRVAVKLLPEAGAADADSLSRFAVEARAIAALGHPHIIQLLDFQTAPVPFIVMELVEGETLRKLLDREPRLAVPRAAFIARQMLSALEAVHAAGVIHRDIKPSNVMIAGSTPVGDLVKLVDFGIAKISATTTNRPQTAFGALIGTPQYMAPEQARGMPVDLRADLHATAVVLFEMLAGYNPFAVGGGAAMALAAVGTVVPPSLETHRGDVPLALAAIVSRALAKEPAQRFQSARELSDALAPFSAQGAPLPAPTSLSAPPTAHGLPPSLAAPSTLGAPPSTVAGVLPPTMSGAPPSMSGAPPSMSGPPPSMSGAPPWQTMQPTLMSGAPPPPSMGASYAPGPAYAPPPVMALAAPPSRGGAGLVIGIAVGLVVVLLIAGGAGAALYLRDASTAGPASAATSATPAPIPIAPVASASASATALAGARGGAPAHAVPGASPAPRAADAGSGSGSAAKTGDCLCLPVNAPSRASLARTRGALMCRCIDPGGGFFLCPAPWLATGPTSAEFRCPTGTDARSVPGATIGGACVAYGGGGPVGHPTNDKVTGHYECFFNSDTRTYGPADHAPCSGYSTDDGLMYNGVTDCR